LTAAVSVPSTVHAQSVATPVQQAAPAQQGAPAQQVVPGTQPESQTANGHPEQFQIMQVLEHLPPYRPLDQIAGKVTLSGSTTMNDVGHQWAKNLKLFHPGLEFNGTAEGSEIALKLLSEDPTIIAGVSRPVDATDQSMLQAGKCKAPIAIAVGMEAMAVFVHKDNPLESLAPESLKSIFAATANGQPKCKVWGDLGVKGPLADQPISIYERDQASGSRVFISRVLLSGAELSSTAIACTSNTEICKSIANDPKGIGFADLNYEHPDVRRVPLAVGRDIVAATEANVLMGKYPIVRPLMLVLDKDQLSRDGKVRESVLRYVLSRDGQLVMMQSGFYPLDPGFVQHQLTELFGQQLR
jgi:phosphate transport system substrate-binding protein